MGRNIVLTGDGSCLGNPGFGGWALMVKVDGVQKGIMTGGGLEKTNNMMEITAIRYALLWLRKHGEPGDKAQLKFDSEYALNGTFKWIQGWEARGWRTADKKPVSNGELWQNIAMLLKDVRAKGIDVQPHWVKGHQVDGDPDNREIDKVARKTASLWRDKPNEAEAKGVHTYEPAAEKEDTKHISISKLTARQKKPGRIVMAVFSQEPENPELESVAGMPILVTWKEDAWHPIHPDQDGRIYADKAFTGFIRVTGLDNLSLHNLGQTPSVDDPEDLEDEGSDMEP